MIRVLPIGHPAHTLELNVPATDELGQPTTLAELERRAAKRPTFANVQALYAALDVAYPDWRRSAFRRRDGRP
jgi:hypothetical protein